MTVTYRIPIATPILTEESEFVVALRDVGRVIGLSDDNLLTIGVDPGGAARIEFGPIPRLEWAQSSGENATTSGALCSITLTDPSALATTGRDHSAFTLAHAALNLTLRSIRSYTLDPLPVPNIHALPPAISYFVSTNDPSVEPSERMFIYDKRVGQGYPQRFTLSPDLVFACSIVTAQLAAGHPSFIVRDIRSHAITSRLIHHDNSAACVQFAVAAEVALDSLLRLMLWEEGLSPADAAALWSTGLMSRVKQLYHPRLGGIWDPRREETPIGLWAIKVAGLRNRVAHAGYQPTDPELDESASCLQMLLDFTTGQLCNASQTYPNSVLRLLSPETALRTTAGKGRAAVRSAIPNLEQMATSFEIWCDSFIDELN